MGKHIPNILNSSDPPGFEDISKFELQLCWGHPMKLPGLFWADWNLLGLAYSMFLNNSSLIWFGLCCLLMYLIILTIITKNTYFPLQCLQTIFIQILATGSLLFNLRIAHLENCKFRERERELISVWMLDSHYLCKTTADSHYDSNELSWHNSTGHDLSACLSTLLSNWMLIGVFMEGTAASLQCTEFLLTLTMLSLSKISQEICWICVTTKNFC